MKTSTHPTAASRREFLKASATRAAPIRSGRAKDRILITWIGAWAFLALTVQAQQPRLYERWRQAYAGEDATGTNVIGLWMFADTKDLLGKGLDAKLQGAVICPDGKFGPCLESFCGYPVEDKRHAAVVANAPSLTPKGAFTLEMWIKPKKELADYPEAFLADKKYVAHTDYQFTLGAADKGGQRRLNMRLGFGEDSESYASEPAIYATNVWHHVAFTYDGAGTGCFYRDGAALGGATKLGRGSVAAGRHPLSIGDRIGSLYHGFPGYIAQVRLCKGALEFHAASFACDSDRNVFVRTEKAPALAFSLANRQRVPMRGAAVIFSLDGAELKRVAVPELASGAACPLEVPFDTSLRPGGYSVRARIEIPGDAPYASEETFPVTLVARQPAADAGGDVGPLRRGQRGQGTATPEGDRVHALPRFRRGQRKDLRRGEADCAGYARECRRGEADAEHGAGERFRRDRYAVAGTLGGGG
jgi:hypothetical protein